MNDSRKHYWQANLKLIALCLFIWISVSFLCGIVFVEQLNSFKIKGYQLGFWFAQQGSIYSFVLLIFFYNWQVGKLDKKYRSQSNES